MEPDRHFIVAFISGNDKTIRFGLKARMIVGSFPQNAVYWAYI